MNITIRNGRSIQSTVCFAICYYFMQFFCWNGDYDRGLKDLDLLKMGFRGWLILDRFFSSDAIPSEP